MRAKQIYESLGDIFKPKSEEEIKIKLEKIKNETFNFLDKRCYLIKDFNIYNKSGNKIIHFNVDNNMLFIKNIMFEVLEDVVGINFNIAKHMIFDYLNQKCNWNLTLQTTLVKRQNLK